VDLVNASNIDKIGDNFVNSGTAYATPVLTPSQSGDLAVAFDLPMTTTALSWTNPSGWTIGAASSTGWHGEALYQTLTSSAAAAENSTLSAAASGFSSLVLITPSSAQPTPTPAPTATPSAAPSPTPTPGPNADWFTFGYDLQRTGYNPGEKTIGTNSFATLHPLWTTLPNVGNYLQGQPVVASNVNVGGTSRTLIYAGGISGKFYAFDTATGSMVWSKQLGTGSYVCPDKATGNWGVEGAAALDRARNRIYVPDGANNIHALDLATGAEAGGWPLNVAAVTSHDFIHVAMTYNAANGLLYAETSSPCDNSPWHGRIIAVNTSSAAAIGTFYPNQGASGGSIWGVGGAAIDPSTNNVFIATGNADASAQSENYSEHIVELSSDLSTVIASSYPADMPFMYDSDFGATPLLFQPVGCPPLLAAVNKSGAFLLYNRTNIAAGPIQEITMAGTGSEFRGVPSYDPVTNYVYLGLPDSQGIYLPGIGAFSITAACTLNPTPAWNGTFGASKDQRSPITIANGVVYVGAYNENTVYAFDAASGVRLWSASLSNSGQIAPVILNGHLYVGDIGGTIHAWTP
jgi:outer membrane protein assembly factor BamB